MGLVSYQGMSSGAVFVTNFCYVSVYLTRKSLVLLFYLYEDTASCINKPPYNPAFQKLNRPTSFTYSSTAAHFLWPLNYFCVTFCTLCTHLKIKVSLKDDFLPQSKAQVAAQIHDLGDIQLRVPVHTPSHGSDVDLHS